MSAGEKAFGLIKTALTMKDQLDGLTKDLDALGSRMTRLTDSHVALRDRVGQIEGFLRAATGAPFAGPPQARIEE
ncbi:hypothetical protein ASG29_14690 [Sphingomonas sp. Leaf412]|uniref:hypothetical protein n=1 Tax=Sphingomonas sp. Leaf412 TaxID=1736370 RepID=UPI0006F5E73C|nr:hypothetical protein [Sphingomonas sp. Leaf412]KQT31221.1 hypothetical protein ASG29_14690 [Sphingomonas sp. Leaf412]